MTKKKITAVVAILLASILVLSIVLTALFYGSITVVEADDIRSFTITATGVGSVKLVYFNMTAATIIYELGSCNKMSGYANARIKAGEYYNSDYGYCYLFIYPSVDAYIVTYMNDGTCVIFNLSTVEETEAMHELIWLRNPYIFSTSE